MPKKTDTKAPRIPKVPKVPMMTPPRMVPRPMQPGPNMPDMLDMDDPMGGAGLLGAVESPEERITRWLEERVFAKNVPGLTLVLKQKSIDGETNAVSWDADELEGQDPSSLATMIYQAAEQDAQEQTAFTRYAIHAYRPGDVQSFTRCFFNVMPENADTAGMNSEPGHLPEGHMAQAHRHAEVYARMMVSMTAEHMRDSREEKRELRNAAARAATQRIEMIDMYEKLQDRAMMRKIVLGRVERKEKLKDQAMAMIGQFIPDIMVKFGVVPGEAKGQLESAAGMMNALCSIQPEQLSQIAGALTPDQQKQFINAYQMAKAAEAKRIARMEAENAKALAEGRPQPHQLQAPAPEQPAQQPIVTPPPTPQAAAPTAPAQTAVKLTEQQVGALPTLTNVFLGTLADLPEKEFKIVAKRLSPEERAAVEKVRKAVQAKKAAVAAASEGAE